MSETMMEPDNMIVSGTLLVSESNVSCVNAACIASDPSRVL